jgi:hypothetical protein
VPPQFMSPCFICSFTSFSSFLSSFFSRGLRREMLKRTRLMNFSSMKSVMDVCPCSSTSSGLRASAKDLSSFSSESKSSLLISISQFSSKNLWLSWVSYESAFENSFGTLTGLLSSSLSLCPFLSLLFCPLRLIPISSSSILALFNLLFIKGARSSA